MKIFNTALALILILPGAVASDSAFAGRGHSGRSGHPGHSGSVARSSHPGHYPRSRVFLAVPVIAPLYFWPSGPYYTQALPASPTVYIEQDSTPIPVREPYSWYYCADSKTYYPYIDICPGGWQQVVPEAPAPSSPGIAQTGRPKETR